VANLSPSQVSEINKGLDEQLEAFRNRPLAAEYPVIRVDTLYEKIQDDGKVISEAILVIYEVNLEENVRFWPWSLCTSSRRLRGWRPVRHRYSFLLGCSGRFGDVRTVMQHLPSQIHAAGIPPT